MSRQTIGWFAVMLTGCGSAHLAPASVRTREGPAAARPIHRVVALGATCGSLQLYVVEQGLAPVEVRECGRDALAGTDQAIRAVLDFAGYEVVDAEQVNAVTAQRHEVEVRRGVLVTSTARTMRETFVDATPAEQAGILKDLRADGVLTTRVWIGAGVGFSSRRTVSVQVRLTSTADRTLVWARRCEIEVGVEADPSAMERAARCAAEGIRPR